MDFDPELFLRDKRQALAKARADLAEAQRKVDVAEAELRGAEDVLSKVGPALAKSARNSTPKSPSGSRGRQPGAISKIWRNILLDLYDEYPEGFTEDAVVFVAELHGLHIRRPSEARRRMESYDSAGYVEIDSGLMRVTAYAAEYFEFDKMRAARSETHNENGPPSGGPDVGGVAAPPVEEPEGEPSVFE